MEENVCCISWTSHCRVMTTTSLCHLGFFPENVDTDSQFVLVGMEELSTVGQKLSELKISESCTLSFAE